VAEQFYKRGSRRRFLRSLAGSVVSGCMLSEVVGHSGGDANTRQPFFKTRGVVLIPDDLTWADWPERAKAAGLTTIGLHHGASPNLVVKFVQSEIGQKFLEQCRKLNLHVEYELHAIKELLPRELFALDPTLFRMNEKGERVADSNLCVHSEIALEIAAEHAVGLAKILRPTTDRYFFWGDDGRPWCRCPKCAGLSDSDQALILENHLLKTLHALNPKAQLAHLAYSNTLPPPKQIKPAHGVFLEFAPLEMRHRRLEAKFVDPPNRRFLDALDANLEVFERDSAQALEYWLDVSMQSDWKKPAKKLVLDQTVLAADLDIYGARGIRHVTTFAVFIDADYVKRFGEPSELATYGNKLLTR